jgi:hypothetical protein
MVDISFSFVVAPAATAKEINAFEQGTWKKTCSPVVA